MPDGFGVIGKNSGGHVYRLHGRRFHNGTSTTPRRTRREGASIMADFVPPAHNSASPFADMRGRHVAVRTPSLEEAKEFYVGKLDFRVVAEWPFADEQLA